MISVCPITLAKNEEIWIARVLAPLVEIFGCAIVADTGSTDDTVSEIEKVPGVHLMRPGNLTPQEIGQCRGWMQAEAKARYGASHVFLVDADELYPRKYLRFIQDNPMADDAMSGYTSGVECTELSTGECWKLGRPDGSLVGVNRQAIFSVDSVWRGVYPFESPDTYVAGHPTNHYWPVPDPSYQFYHLHQMRRSRHDEDVYMRMQKKYQFSLQAHPEIVATEFWLKSERDYADE